VKGHLELRETKGKLPRGHHRWSIIIETGHTPSGGRGRRRFTFYGSKTQAEAELARLVHQVETGALLNQDRLTVAEYLKHWLEVYAKPNTAPRTYERYEEIVRLHLSPALGAHRLGKLTPMHIQSYYEDALREGRKLRTRKDPRSHQRKSERVEPKSTPKGLSARTVLHHHRLLRQALQQAVRWQMIYRNPADAVRPPRAVSHEMHVLNEDEVVKVLRSLEGTPFHFPFLLAVNTGVRRGELLGLRWSDCDLQSGVVLVNRALQDVGGELIFKEPKTARSRRRIPLPKSALEALKQHRREQVERRLSLGDIYQDNDLVICRDDGRPWNPGSFSGEWRREAKRLGLKLRWHELRHTHATLLGRAGEHPKVIQERLGHASITTTMNLYSQVLPDMQERAAERLEALLSDAEAAAENEHD
jgi:integrase